jgi:hypothetical protein
LNGTCCKSKMKLKIFNFFMFISMHKDERKKFIFQSKKIEKTFGSSSLLLNFKFQLLSFFLRMQSWWVGLKDDQYKIKMRYSEGKKLDYSFFRQHVKHHVPTISIDYSKNSRFNSFVGFQFNQKFLLFHFVRSERENQKEILPKKRALT